MVSVSAGGYLIENLAKAVDIGLRRAGAFGWNIAICPDEGVCVRDPRNQSDVGKLWAAVHEDDIRRLDVAVNKAAFMQVAEGPGQGNGEVPTFVSWQAAAFLDFTSQSPRKVGLRV